MKLTISQEVLDLLKKRNCLTHPLLLIVDGGGGDYSIEGGSCSLGADYSLISLDTKTFDSRYPLKITNNANLEIYTSDYDQAFLGQNLILDIKNTTMRLRNDSGILTGNVKLGRASLLSQVAKEGIKFNKYC